MIRYDLKHSENSATSGGGNAHHQYPASTVSTEQQARLTSSYHGGTSPCAPIAESFRHSAIRQCSKPLGIRITKYIYLDSYSSAALQEMAKSAPKRAKRAPKMSHVYMNLSYVRTVRNRVKCIHTLLRIRTIGCKELSPREAVQERWEVGMRR